MISTFFLMTLTLVNSDVTMTSSYLNEMYDVICVNLYRTKI